MRKIKFRAWHKKRKKFYKVLWLHIKTIMNGGMWATCEGFDIIDQKEIHIQIQPEECLIEQFTGLKDKNGMEIYEGDIVTASSDFAGDEHTDSYSRCYVGKIVFLPSKGTCMRRPIWTDVDNKESGKSNYDMPLSAYRSTVIGNIHENPELLEVSHE